MKSDSSLAVLEIGCYTGYSAMAWYEATAGTQAEIVTLELDSKMIEASLRTFDKFSLHDRVKLIQGPAQKSLDGLDGQFDLIFVDANKDGYESYVKTILQQKLLSPQGLILCDNGKPKEPKADRQIVTDSKCSVCTGVDD